MKASGVRRRLGTAAVACTALVLVGAPSASASSVVYIGADKNVHLVSPDGTVKHQVTTDATADFPYRSPSQTTAGKVVAIRKVENPEGTDYSFAFFLDRQTGAVTDNWIIPPRSGPFSFSPVTGGQISPGGGMFVYDSFYGPGLWGTASIDVGFVSGPGASSPCTLNCEYGYWEPRWIPGTDVAGFLDSSSYNETIYVQTTGGPQPWLGFSNPDAVDLDSFDVSTTGRTLIEITPDGVPPEGSTEQAELQIYSNNGTPPGGNPELRCYVPDFASAPARPRWSPDGGMIAWEDADGVYVAPAPTTTGGGVCDLQATLVAAGGTRPDWGPQDTPIANEPPTADAGGPYSVAEGASLALNGSGTDADGDPLTYSWDVNGDGTFGDASGASPTLSWAQLQGLGVTDGPRTIDAAKLRVSDGTNSTDSAATTINVTNRAPSLAISGPAAVDLGAGASWTFAADDDAGPDDAAGFSYAIDWNGDGATDETASGTGPRAVSHTFSSPGTFTIKATATDKDGGESSVATKDVTVSSPGEPDADGDGLPDASDDCPDAAGPASNGGCPTGGGGDAAAPDTVIDSGPKKKMKKKKAKFEFHATEAGSTFECSLNGAPFQSCASPTTVKAKKGKNRFQVRATDAAGNVDQSPATHTWKFKKKKKQ